MELHINYDFGRKDEKNMTPVWINMQGNDTGGKLAGNIFRTEKGNWAWVGQDGVAVYVDKYNTKFHNKLEAAEDLVLNYLFPGQPKYNR